MARKSKQPGGNMPLTYSERSKLTSYGTQSARLTSDSQLRFGDCCLQLTPAVDPVVTPSGHIYSRETIVSYLLTKSQELKEQKAKYQAQLASDAQKASQQTESAKTLAIQSFISKDQGAAQSSTKNHSTDYQKSLKRKIDTESKEEGNKRLKEISYWLSEAQPEYHDEAMGEKIRSNMPPERPSSPMSGNPLRLKELVPITLNRGNGDGAEGKCLCAVSNKEITTQPVIAIKKTGVVILKDVYDQVVKTKNGKGMVCPVKGKKFKEKDVIVLSKGKSGFAASGDVVASKYTPTMT